MASNNAYGPQIVTEGLVLHLDAGNAKSYPGAGDVWYDISKGGYNGGINAYNGSDGSASDSNPAFNTNGVGGGWFEFRSSNLSTRHEVEVTMDEPVLRGYTEATTVKPWTLEVWVRSQGAPYSNESFVVGRLGHHSGILQDATASRWDFQIRTTSGGTGAIDDNSQSAVTGVWAHLVLSWSNRVASLFKDGRLFDVDIMSTSYPVYNHSSILKIGGYNNNNYRCNADISVVRAYTRALTAAEVKQNYNTHRSRFGL
jgi:hypothetical protein